MIMLIDRSYPFLRARTSRALVAIGVALLIAGCGSSGGGAPVPGQASVDATGNATASAATSQGTFDPQLANQSSKSSSASASGLVASSAQSTTAAPPADPTTTVKKTTSP